MKQIQSAMSKMALHGADKSKALTKEVDAKSNGETDSPVWTVGQEFQFYVPWLWKDSPAPPPDNTHPNRQVVRIPRPEDLAEFTEEAQEVWIRHHVTAAVKDLVYQMQYFMTCTEEQLQEWYYDQKKAWEHFNIVQNDCDLPVVTLPGYDGVVPVEMTLAIKKVSIRCHDGSSPSVEWATWLSPGKCIEWIKDHVRIHLTTECSTHTHVRPERMLDLNLQSFKKMASLLWLAEERLNKLYHPARNSPPSSLHRSLRRCSNLALDKDPLVTGSLGDLDVFLGPLSLDATEKNKLAIIWLAMDSHQLRELLRVHPSVGKHDSPAYNFFNLFLASQKQTIEFRKTESTIDAQVIDAWVEVFLLLTNFCMACSVKTFQRLVENLGKANTIYNTWHLLRDVGCNSLTIDVLRKKFMQQSPPEEPAPRPGPGTSNRSRLRYAIRDGTERFGANFAGGYSYGG